MANNLEFERAIEAIRAGDNAAGQRILVGILKNNPKNELAWLWLSRALTDENQRIAALEQCLKVNPNSDIARKALSQLQKQSSSGEAVPSQLNVDERPVQSAQPAKSQPAIAPPSQTPLRDRLVDRRYQTADRSSVQPDSGVTAKPKKRPRRPRTFGPLEIGLVLLVLVALISLAYVYFNQNQRTGSDLAARALAATENALEAENADLRSEISQRQTQAAAPSNTPTETLDVSTTPRPSLTPTRTGTPEPTLTPIPGWIAPENLSDLRVRSEFEGLFFGDLEFSSDGAYLAASSSDMVKVWDANSWEETHQLALESRATALSFSQSSDLLFFAQAGLGNESFINSLTVNDWTIALSGIRSTNPIAQLMTTQDSTTLIIGLVATTSNVNFFSLSNNTMLGFVEHPDGLIAMDINPSTNFLATGGYDDSIWIWDLVSYQSVATLSGFVSDVTAVSFAPAGDLLAAASRAGEIRIWDARTWRLLKRLQADQTDIVQLAFSKNNRMLISGGSDGVIAFWDLETYESLTEIITPIGLADLEISPDGETLAVSSESMIRLYTSPNP